MARPKKKLDEKQIANYARLGCSNVDIANMMGVHEALIRRRFADLLAKSRSERRSVIHGWQWEAAKKGNVAMMIWLGKQELGQTDKQEQRVGGLSGGAIQVETDRSAMARLLASPEIAAKALELAKMTEDAKAGGKDGAAPDRRG